jgi:hypothetical protein
MPQAAAAAVALAKSAYAAYSASRVLQIVAQIAFSLGTTALVQSLNKPPKPADRREGLRGEIMARQIHFGTTLAGSAVVYDDVASKVRWQVHVHNHGRCVNVRERRFGGAVYPVAANGQLLPYSRFQDVVYAEFRDGAEDQPPSVLMRQPETRTGPLPAPGWTDAHRLRGLCYSVIRAPSIKAEKFQEVYPEGRPPVPTIVGDFGEPLDPRTGTRGFSPNGALIFAWWQTHPLGGRLSEDKIDWDSIAAAADLCDSMGYELAGSWLADESPKVTQANMLAALDASMWTDQTGRVRLDIGRWQDPVIRIGMDQVLQISSLSAGAGEGDAVSELIVKYIDRARDYSEVEDVAASVDAPVYAPKVADLTYCPTQAQALRLGRRIFARERARWRLEATLNLSGLRLINKRFVEVHLPDFGLHHEPMELDGWGFDPAAGQVVISARSARPEDFA